MSQRQLASVLFATVGVFIAALRLPEIVLGIVMMSQWDPVVTDSDPVARWSAVSSLGVLLATVLISVELVLLRDRLANRLFPPEASSAGASELQAVAISVLGCYFAVQGLATLSHMWALSGELDWAGLTQLVLGVALFFGSRGLSRLWSLARTAGRSSGGSDRVL